MGDIAESHIIPLTEGSSIAESARWVLGQAPPAFALVGFSQGAVVALDIMRRAPERVLTLCLTSANPRGSSPEQLETWITWQERVRTGGSDELEAIASGFARNVHPERRGDRVLTGQILEMARDTGPETFITQLDALASRSDSRPYLSDIRCPTLLVAGQQDPVTPVALHEEMQALIPNAVFVAVETCGHYVPLEQPARFTAILRDWLKGASTR